MAANEIYYLSGEKIDHKKWNACIDAASNGLIYAYSFYLDAMADHWDALVLNDYETVMPLPWRKKWGISYLYQPFLAAQLGLFGQNVNADLLKRFLQAIPKKFKLWEFSLNHQNLFSLSGYSLNERCNYILLLNNNYETIFKSYRDNNKRNIKKAIGYGCIIKRNISIQAIIELNKLQGIDATCEADYHRLQHLYQQLQPQGNAITYGVFHNDQLVASCCFWIMKRRAYYIFVGNHPNGRTLGASHLLIDAFIKEHSGQNLLLDFEGSDLRNLAFFYSSFGASEEKYAAIQYNNLPWYVKLLKR
ncbi:MAG: hypothetical protein C4329_06715 [Chitinophagaceae bacterium]